MSTRTKPVTIGPITLGGADFVLIAGPCSIESFEQFDATSRHVLQHGASIVRGGVYKLRTKAETFQGLGPKAFDILGQVKERHRFPFIAEITDPRQLDELYSRVEAFQVGSRNMHNYELLKELGRQDKPVVLKRGFAGLISEWLNAADYVIKGGNEQLVLCERGIRTFETAYRNTFDLNAIAYLKQNCPFPIIADPSHATGQTSLVTPMALAAATAGADAIMVEVHPKPSEALSDGYQALNFADYESMVAKLRRVLTALDRPFAGLQDAGTP
jgi:3-deoxy-7-phosphoheptulonate synthase